jgi:hypothetical protein
MADGTISIQSLNDLLDLAGDEGFDWDPSALADWPNIAPAYSTAPSFPMNLPDEGHHAS